MRCVLYVVRCALSQLTSKRRNRVVRRVVDMVHVALEDRPSFGLIRKASESGPSILVPPILKVDSAGIGAVMRGSAPDSFVDVKCIHNLEV